jgi:hypothetical protein
VQGFSGSANFVALFQPLQGQFGVAGHSDTVSTIAGKKRAKKRRRGCSVENLLELASRER